MKDVIPLLYGDIKPNNYSNTCSNNYLFETSVELLSYNHKRDDYKILIDLTWDMDTFSQKKLTD